MNQRQRILFSVLSLALICGGIYLLSAVRKMNVDLIVYNATIYTVNRENTIHSAFAVRHGRFVAVGTDSEILSNYSTSNKIDLKGAPVYPGFIDAHCHFYRYGLFLNSADLTGAASFEEVIQRVRHFRKEHPDHQWIIGRGWDQNNWPSKIFPDKKELDRLFPNTPVYLIRIDGHAALVNQKALDLAGITANTLISGGEIGLESNQLSGILIDNALAKIEAAIPVPTHEEQVQALTEAQEKCFSKGLTTVDDAGLDKNIILLIDQLQREHILKMRIYAMINPSDSNKKYFLRTGPIKTDHLNVRSFKIYGDGALGSRGACLLQPYSDQPDHRGFMLHDQRFFQATAVEIYKAGFQMNTHCIGDSANKEILRIYKHVLKGKNGHRWRIEHAQVVAPEDLRMFSDYSVIPSVQPTHATSDMYWAGSRLGNDRLKHAYAYHDLLDQAGILALGSDFPVEHIDPLLGFYAATVRKDANDFPESGFQPENKISREQALRGMTIWAAFANFEEQEKGSIETGKFADFVVTSSDLMKVSDKELLKVKVKETFIGGRKVF